MSRCSRSLPTLALLAVVVVVVAASPAFAGPPLLCHPFDIGSARSLPWDGTRGWSHASASYDISKLVADTEAILTPSTPVIVRMETLRRAAIYAVHEERVMKELFVRLMHRAQAAERVGQADGLAFLDAAYLIGALHQLARVDETRSRAEVISAVVGSADAYALVKKALSVRDGDAATQFAAALIAADGNRAAFAEHARKAREGAAKDALLARNIGAIS